MSLRPITIGIVPKAAPGSVGLVGMPVWMWVASPGPAVLGTDHEHRVGGRLDGHRDRDGCSGSAG